MSGPVVPAVALCRYGAGRPCLRVHFTGGRPGRDVVYHHQDGGTESDRAASRIRVRVEWFHGSWNEDTAAARAFRAFWSLRWCVSAGRAGGAASPASLGKRQVSGSIPLTGSTSRPGTERTFPMSLDQCSQPCSQEHRVRPRIDLSRRSFQRQHPQRSVPAPAAHDGQDQVLSEYVLLPTAKLVAPRSVRAGDSFVRVSA
jgi:hypothetical protein